MNSILGVVVLVLFGSIYVNYLPFIFVRILNKITSSNVRDYEPGEGFFFLVVISSVVYIITKAIGNFTLFIFFIPPFLSALIWFLIFKWGEG